MVVFAFFQDGLPIPARILFIFLAIFCFWVGWFGKRDRYSTIQEDISDHFERKERHSPKNRYQPIENRIDPKKQE